MSANASGTVQIGELVVAAFDWAARFSDDPKQVSRLARIVLQHILERAHPFSVELKGSTRHLD